MGNRRPPLSHNVDSTVFKSAVPSSTSDHVDHRLTSSGHQTDRRSVNYSENNENSRGQRNVHPMATSPIFRQGSGPSSRRVFSSRNADANAGIDVPLSRTNIYIRGLPPECTADDLQTLCCKYGRITSTKAVIDQDTNRCRGYGFVDFESAEAAAQALADLNGDGVHHAQMAKEVRGRSTDRVPQHLEQDPTNLYIANLPSNYGENDIRDLFAPHGLVISTRVLRHPDMSSRCVGFARMESKDSCDEIINFYNGRTIQEGTEPLVVKLADSGGRRPKHSTSSSGGQSVTDPNTIPQWTGNTGNRYQYAPAAAYAGDPAAYQAYQQFLPNSGIDFNPNTGEYTLSVGYHIYDPNSIYPMTNVPAAQFQVNPYSAPMYQSGNRQVNVPAPTPTQPPPQLSSQVPVFPPNVNPVDFYNKNRFNSSNTYFNPYVPYQEYVAGQQQFVPPAYTASNVSANDFSYTNGANQAMYMPNQFIPSQPSIQNPQALENSAGPNPSEVVLAGPSRDSITPKCDDAPNSSSFVVSDPSQNSPQQNKNGADQQLQDEFSQLNVGDNATLNKSN